MKGKGTAPFLIKHFKNSACFDAGFSVNILEKLDGSGLIRGKVNKTKIEPRRRKETEWMLRLRSVFPYGFNHDVGNKQLQGE